jgi:putative pyoverdin transport system ATP-binding/permease protein
MPATVRARRHECPVVTCRNLSFMLNIFMSSIGSLATSLALVLLLASGQFAFGLVEKDTLLTPVMEKEVLDLMKQGDIPGLSLVLIKDGRQQIISYGYADRGKKTPVTSQTLFELGSCSKAFTALAVLLLERQHQIDLDAPVSDYIPWLHVNYEDRPVAITVRQVLHHTSGIPWNTISDIPATTQDDALEETVGKLVGIELIHLPGKKYEYATINYDILALIIQYVTKQSFEFYLQANVIDPLGLSHTSIGYPRVPTLKATGYKIGFFRSREYDPPVFRGNNAAGYVTSDAFDVAQWLRFQMGLSHSELYALAGVTHQRDETVALHGMASYAMGWEVSLSGNGEIMHSGLNPSFSTFLVFRPKTGLGVAVLTNSSNSFTTTIGSKVMKLLAGEEIKREVDPDDGNDKAFSIVAFIVSAYVLMVMIYLFVTVSDIARGRRTYERFSWKKFGRLMSLLAILSPFLLGLYILPVAIYDFSWQSIVIWTPASFPVAVFMILAALGISYVTCVIDVCFPEQNKFRRIAPRLVLLSTLSGLANMLVIILITSSLESKVELKYLVFYYFLTFSVYLLGRRYVQVELIRFTMSVIYDLRVSLIEKMLATSYQRFEKIDRGRVYTAMNDDVGIIGESTNMSVMLITSFFTAAGAFLYLASIAFWASMLTILMIISLTTLYYLVSRSTNKFYEEARDSRNVFMKLINGVIDGFKEISLHSRKKQQYKDDVSASANEYRAKMSTASIRFVHASLVGEIVLIGILGGVVFIFPRLFPGIKNYTLMGFVIVLLYLIGPVNTILSSVPAVMRLRIAWRRIRQFLAEIPVSAEVDKAICPPVFSTVESIRAEGLRFQYKDALGHGQFEIGPIDLEVTKGEILFIIGDNGSGKTTLMKLLTGLYAPDQGRVKINGREVAPAHLGEYFSTVFSPIYLFERLYSIDTVAKHEDIGKYLKLLDIEHKVKINENTYSTINLSGGQRKRLALLQCYLEDSPIYLFDEWAADQDPEYRLFFYRTLLPTMKARGKVVIAITHDDHYFDVADKVLRMNQGKLEVYSEKYLAPVDSLKS